MIVYQTICPCKDCTNRVLSCHGKCKDYNDWKNGSIEVRRDYVPKHKPRRKTGVFGRK
jgi:hypothetical protein